MDRPNQDRGDKKPDTCESEFWGKAPNRKSELLARAGDTIFSKKFAAAALAASLAIGGTTLLKAGVDMLNYADETHRKSKEFRKANEINTQESIAETECEVQARDEVLLIDVTSVEASSHNYYFLYKSAFEACMSDTKTSTIALPDPGASTTIAD